MKTTIKFDKLVDSSTGKLVELELPQDFVIKHADAILEKAKELAKRLMNEKPS